jgi:hypothetical protein
MRRIVVSLLALQLSGCFSGCPKTVSRPPLTVRVTDAETGRALEGIRVDYRVGGSITRPKFLGLFHALDPTLGFKLLERSHGVTDSAGELVLRFEQVRVAGNEEPAGELVFINVEVDPTSPIASDRRASLDFACRQRQPSCSGVVDEVEVAWSLYPDEEGLRAILRPSDESHQGMVLYVGTPPAEGQLLAASSEPLDFMRVISRRTDPETIEVRLQRPR